MHNQQSFKELKATARKGLKGNYGHAISLFITTELLSLLPAYIVVFLFSGDSLFNNVCSEIVSFILSVFLQVSVLYENTMQPADKYFRPFLWLQIKYQHIFQIRITICRHIHCNKSSGTGTFIYLRRYDINILCTAWWNTG